MLRLIGRKYFQFYAQKFSLSKHMHDKQFALNIVTYIHSLIQFLPKFRNVPRVTLNKKNLKQI